MPSDKATQKYCPRCTRRSDDDSLRYCPHDKALLSLDDPYNLVGQTLLGKYRIEALVGIGGMGAVYGAYHLNLNRRVAFKIFQPNLAVKNRSALQLFEREGHMAARLTHPNIVTTYDAGRATDTIAYIAMEWLEGVTLEDELAKGGALSLDRAAKLLRQICAALDEAHDNHIIHRDLKPANVMLVTRRDGQEQVKVLDFGIGKILDSTAGAQVSRIMGTPNYASPEQFQVGVTIDHRSDIYSLGVMLFELLTDHLPFTGDTWTELMNHHLHTPPPSLRQYRPELPEAVAQLVLQMLAKQPVQRPPRISEVPELFARALRASEPTIIDPQPQPLPPKPSPPVLPAQTARARKPVIIGAIVAVALLVLLSSWLMNRSTSPIQLASQPPPIVSTTSAPSSTPPSASQPVMTEALRYSLDFNPANGRAFRFHFTPKVKGYLYLVALDDQKQLTTFLTARPHPSTGVTTNRAAAGADFQFFGKGQFIEMTTDSASFTLIFSTQPLTQSFFNI